MSKAVSPILASLFLIIIAVVLAGVFFVATRGLAQDRLTEVQTATVGQVDCAYAGVQVNDCNFLNSSDKITFRLVNTGQATLSAFTISAWDGTNLVKASFSKSVSPGTFVFADSSVSANWTTADGAISNLTSLRTLRVTPTACPANYYEAPAGTCANN